MSDISQDLEDQFEDNSIHHCPNDNTEFKGTNISREEQLRQWRMNRILQEKNLQKKRKELQKRAVYRKKINYASKNTSPSATRNHFYGDKPDEYHQVAMPSGTSLADKISVSELDMPLIGKLSMDEKSLGEVTTGQELNTKLLELEFVLQKLNRQSNYFSEMDAFMRSHYNELLKKQRLFFETSKSFAKHRETQEFESLFEAASECITETRKFALNCSSTDPSTSSDTTSSSKPRAYSDASTQTDSDISLELQKATKCINAFTMVNCANNIMHQKIMELETKLIEDKEEAYKAQQSLKDKVSTLEIENHLVETELDKCKLQLIQLQKSLKIPKD